MSTKECNTFRSVYTSGLKLINHLISVIKTQLIHSCWANSNYVIVRGIKTLIYIHQYIRPSVFNVIQEKG